MLVDHTPADYHSYIELLDEAGEHLKVLRHLRADGGPVDWVENCKFTLYRQGGCGEGQFTVTRPFTDKDFRVGRFIRVYYGDPTAEDAESWYYGRVQRVEGASPSGYTVYTYGLSSILEEIQVGGRGAGDFRNPHLFAHSDIFPDDPDRSIQSWTTVESFADIVRALAEQYIEPAGITIGTIEEPDLPPAFKSLVMRGEETVTEMLRMLATACYGASWGVDGDGEFFFLNKPKVEEEGGSPADDFQEGVDCTSVSSNEDMDQIINALNIYGDYDYAEDGPSRFQVTWADAASVALYGVKQKTVYIGFFRTYEDSELWAQQVFEDYAQPVVKHKVTSYPLSDFATPWEGRYGLKDKAGDYLHEETICDVLEVEFTAAPIITLEYGPEEWQYPEPPEMQRWEQPQQPVDDGGGGDVSLSLSGTLSSISLSFPDKSFSEPGTSGDGSGDGSLGGSGETGSGSGGSSGSSASSATSSGSASSSGSAKDTAIVPASWSPTGYTAVFVVEADEVALVTRMWLEVNQTDQHIPIDPKFLEICEPNSITCFVQSDQPVPVGAKVTEGSIVVRFGFTNPSQKHILSIMLYGIRKGFANVRLPDKTFEEFLANEAWLQRGGGHQ